MMNLIYIRYIYIYEGKNINNKINETFILLIILASNQINDIIIYIYHNLNNIIDDNTYTCIDYCTRTLL